MSSPFIDAGYTDKTVFKVLENYYGLKEGQLVIIYRDDNTSSPPVNNKNGNHEDMYLPNTRSPELEVVALDGIKEGILDEDGNLKYSTYDEWLESKEKTNKECVVADVLKRTTQTKRTPQDYRELSPDTMIKIVVDGHEGEVELFDLMLATHAVGSVCMNPRPNQTWDFLVSLFEEEGFNPICNGLNSEGSVEFIDTDKFKEYYFISSKTKELKGKLESKQKEREALDSEIQALQSELENL